MKTVPLFHKRIPWLRRKPDPAFAGELETVKAQPLIDEFIKFILSDVEPLFVSDESTIWDFNDDFGSGVQQKCLGHYGVELTHGDLDLPIFILVQKLDRSRARTLPAEVKD